MEENFTDIGCVNIYDIEEIIYDPIVNSQDCGHTHDFCSGMNFNNFQPQTYNHYNDIMEIIERHEYGENEEEYVENTEYSKLNENEGGSDMIPNNASYDEISTDMTQRNRFWNSLFQGIPEDRAIEHNLKPVDYRTFNYGKTSLGVDWLDEFIGLTLQNGNIVDVKMDRELVLSILTKRMMQIRGISFKDKEDILSVINKLPYHVISIKDFKKLNTTSSFVRNYKEYTESRGHPMIAQYECAIQYINNTEKAQCYFVDLTGHINILKSISYPRMDDGIYITSKGYDEIDDDAFRYYGDPSEGSIVLDDDVILGVFYQSHSEMNRDYIKQGGNDVRNDSGERRRKTLKSMVGTKISGTGFSDISHGYINQGFCISLNREELWISGAAGVYKLPCITPNSDNDGFIKMMRKYDISKNDLENNDIIYRFTKIGQGKLNKPLEIEAKMYKIPRPGSMNLGDKLMDKDFVGISKTGGMAIFTTKESAEKCYRLYGGDAVKFFEGMSEKSTYKTEKFKLFSGVKEAVIMGIGAFIPKIIEGVIRFIKTKTKGDSMSIKGLTPAISKLSFSGITGFVGKVVKSVKNFIGGVFGKITSFTMPEWVKNTFGKVVEVGSKIVRKTIDTVKSIGKKVFGFIGGFFPKFA